MANLTVTWDDETRVVRFRGFLAGTLPRVKKGLISSGFVVEKQIVKNLSGKRSPGNPYPGWVSTKLKTSVTAQASSDGMTVSVGPNTEYAAIQEFGGKIEITDRMRRFLHATGIHPRATTTAIVIPARPYVRPSWKQSREKVIDVMRRAIAGKA